MAENKMAPLCAASLGNVIEETTWLTHLNLSGKYLPNKVQNTSRSPQLL